MRKFYLLFALVVQFGIVDLHAGDRFQLGDIEGIGAIQYLLVKNDKQPAKYSLSISPAVSFYLTEFLYLGPITSFTVDWTRHFSSQSIALGGNAGLVAPIDFPIKPYVGGSWGVLFENIRDELNSNPNTIPGNYNTNENGKIYSLYCGIKIVLAKNVFLNFQPTYIGTDFNDNFTTNSSTNTFAFQGALTAKVFSRN